MRVSTSDTSTFYVHRSFLKDRLLRCFLALTVAILPLGCATVPGDPSPPASVKAIYLADRDLLALQIVEGQIIREGQVDFVPGPNDRLEPVGNTDVLAWSDGAPAWVADARRVIRRENGVDRELGFYLPHVGKLWKQERRIGVSIDPALLDRPTSYRIRFAGHSGEVRPLEVWRKSKPLDHVTYGTEAAVGHTLYLRLPREIRKDLPLRLSFNGLPLDVRHIDFAFDATWVQTEAIHVSQVGYRPDDPSKRALLSLWKGTGGAHDYEARVGQVFKIIDADTAEPVFEGTIEPGLAASDTETVFSSPGNHAATSVYVLDFSPLRRPGRYRILIEDLGVSAPFGIGKDAWTEAFRVSMQGLLHHRSGIELGPPLTSYQRPRPFHPADGVRILQTDTTILDGESDAIRESLRNLAGSAPEVAQAWGGYMDAGDWDRRSQHLNATHLLLELLEMFPDHFAAIELRVPDPERSNHLPDLLDEALWNVNFYARLQMQDGGVRGGVESTAHPRKGEASWQESLLVGAFAPDPVTSFRFAATAAKAARLLGPFDSSASAELAAGARRAWTWAVEQPEPDGERKIAAARVARALAAVELAWTFHEPGFLEGFSDLVGLHQGPDSWRPHASAIFTCARMPEGLGDEQLKRRCAGIILELADTALAFQSGNVFGLATDSPGLPMIGYVGYFSVPGMISQSLPRAHFLSGDARYLEGVVASTNFPNGANPANLVYTTGIGSNYPRHPLHIDHRITAQPVPSGITIYGPSNPALSYPFNDWAHQWYLAPYTTPDSRTWPATEAHFDLFTWPAQSEYTIQQTIAPTAYVWGYLSARP